MKFFEISSANGGWDCPGDIRVDKDVPFKDIPTRGRAAKAFRRPIIAAAL